MIRAGKAGIPPCDQFGDHDHGACVDRVLDVANGLRLTPVRRRVLEILLESHTALGAYDILKRLGQDGVAPQPPVAYRALDFLIAQRLVHRIERLNAYVACAHPERAHDPAFLICRCCRSVAEAEAEPATGALGKAAREAGLKIEATVVEAIGLCPSCEAEGEP